VLIEAAAHTLPFDHQGFRVYRESFGEARAPVSGELIESLVIAVTDSLPPLGPVTYWIAGVASTGAVSFHASIPVGPDPSLGFALFPGRPNPFRSETRIIFQTAREGPVQVRVFDLRGRVVTELQDGVLPPGAHTLSGDGRDRGGRAVPAGMYFCRLHGVEGDRTERLLRLAP
jgi:hypothetical protein